MASVRRLLPDRLGRAIQTKRQRRAETMEKLEYTARTTDTTRCAIHPANKRVMSLLATNLQPGDVFLSDGAEVTEVRVDPDHYGVWVETSDGNCCYLGDLYRVRIVR